MSISFVIHPAAGCCVVFCVVGALDSAWSRPRRPAGAGAATAAAAGGSAVAAAAGSGARPAAVSKWASVIW